MSFTPTKDQIIGAIEAKKWWREQNDPFFVVSGAPGTGKTTFCRYLIEEIGLSLDQVLFVSFMGKAATRMAQNGINAKTIDSAIYYYRKEPTKDENGNYLIGKHGSLKLTMVKHLRTALPKKYKLIVVEEYGMVNKQYGEDLASFGLPIIFLGDENQISPPFGSRFIERDPNVTLRQIMRQSENDPIVWLCQQIIHNRRLEPGQYGNSMVLRKEQINREIMIKSDIIITQSNQLRYQTNQLFREEFRKYKRLDILHVNEKVVCRKNNWSKEINHIYMTNGMTGFVDHIYADELKPDRFVFDFRPDFLPVSFGHIKADYKSFFLQPGTEEYMENQVIHKDKFEFAYAITDYSSQGSEWNTVLCFHEKRGKDSMEILRRLYTAVSRAKKAVYIVI